ncbi:hypothetical protein FA95DRAFT_1557026 [Auriscalpium vulgare]|uniref:Uncharacterized protein n=1 Tax=Auriscalpium vulgare TaxID=40419 RepID=A0ACB8RZP8_9AGAM|nr:hypothetical protein FA95DRAFT_1557026 [Auriscalpium vulgare]
MCPLCRKPFTQDRVRKLHVDRFETSPAGVVNEEASELLNRIAQNSHDTTARETLLEVLESTKKWLGRDDHSLRHPGVQISFTLLMKYLKLQERRNDLWRDYMSLEEKLVRRDRDYDHERRKSEAIEERLLGEKQALETQVLTLQSVLGRAQSENTFGNPLPRPPQPYFYGQETRDTYNHPRGERDPYTRTHVPQNPPRSTAGVSFIAGAAFEDRVVPQRPASREHRRRDSSAEEQKAAEKARRRERRRQRAEREEDDGEDTVLVTGQILPGNALGIGPSPAVHAHTPRAPSVVNYIYAPRPVVASGSERGSSSTSLVPVSSAQNSLGLINTPMYPPTSHIVSAGDDDGSALQHVVDDAPSMPGGLPSFNDAGRPSPSPSRRTHRTPRSSWSSSSSTFLPGLTGFSEPVDDRDDADDDFPTLNEGQLLGVGLNVNRGTSTAPPREQPQIYRPTPSRASMIPPFVNHAPSHAGGNRTPAPASRSHTAVGNQSSHTPSQSRGPGAYFPYVEASSRQEDGSGTWAQPRGNLPPGWPYAPGHFAGALNPYNASATSLHSQRSGYRP